MAPSNLWGSDASSSIYSNAQDPPIDVKPLITRKDSASAQSNHSTASKSSTIYSEESIKSMGYRPFEYWKARKPAGRPPGRPPPPPLALPRFTGTNPMKPVNSLQDFKPLPRAKILEVQTYVMDAAPPSPRVKDRYAARLAERARRKRERQQRIEAWPGWVPDEKVLGRQQQQQQQQHRRRVRIVEDEEEAALSKRASSVSMTLRERWMRPRTWRRRVWGIVVSVGVLVLIAVIIVSTTISQDNAPGLKTARYARLDYRLAETFEAEDFFDHFTYLTTPSAPGESVYYATAAQAKELNLTASSLTSAVLRVDTSIGNRSRPDASGGRYSARLMSKRQFDTGLFVFDVKHTPYGCGTQSVLQLAAPAHGLGIGQMNVMAATNLGSGGNDMALLTGAGCEVGNSARNMTGTAITSDCAASSATHDGCVVAGGGTSFGNGFNVRGGGILALEWRAEGIRMWQFPRDSVPLDVQQGVSPDPSTWSASLAEFPSTDCQIASHFQNQSVVMDIGFCGSKAVEAYAAADCPLNCVEYVANYPQAFAQAYWEFGSFKVYGAVQ